MKYVVLFFLKLYSLYISPFIHMLSHALGTGDRFCIYEPTCSRYMHDAVTKYGVIKGIVLGVKRILRCNPFYKGGFDPVP